MYVSFVISKDGSVKDVNVVRGLNADCDQEAIRLVRSMPKWIPGRSEGCEDNRTHRDRIQIAPVRFLPRCHFYLVNKSANGVTQGPDHGKRQDGKNYPMKTRHPEIEPLGMQSSIANDYYHERGYQRTIHTGVYQKRMVGRKAQP